MKRQAIIRPIIHSIFVALRNRYLSLGLSLIFLDTSLLRKSMNPVVITITRFISHIRLPNTQKSSMLRYLSMRG
jgi:hypothetical protein